MNKEKTYLLDMLYDERDAAAEKLDALREKKQFDDEFLAIKNYRNMIMKAIRDEREKK